MNLSKNSRRFRYALLVIAAVALVIRLVVAFELKSSYPPVASPSPQTDAYTYIQAASTVVDGTYDYSKGFYYQPFIYAVYLPCIFLVFGKGATGIIIVQSALGAATVFICGWLFAMIFGRRCGLIAAILLALARLHIFYTPFALIACLLSFLISLVAFTAAVALLVSAIIPT